jgi:predicted RNA binding protein YcfA (HicA-like mRNA interferase family)
MNYRELTKKLKGIGCYEIERRGGGSHRKWLNPARGRGTTIPNWGQKDLKDGTITAVCRQVGIDKNSLVP